MPREAKRCLASLAGVEDPQDDQHGAVVSILENVVASQHLQHELPVFLAPSDGATEFGLSCEDLGSCDDRIGDERRQLRRLLVEERPEPIQVGESIIRPLQLY